MSAKCPHSTITVSSQMAKAAGVSHFTKYSSEMCIRDSIMTDYYENLPVTTVAAGDSYAGFDTESMTTDPDHIAFLSLIHI